MTLGDGARSAGRRWLARSRAAIGGLAVCALLAGCSGGAARPGRPSDGAVATGRRLFVTQHCGSCHALRAVHARGGSGPDFDSSERLDLAQLRSALTEGANGMPSYARLGPRRLDALAAFLDSVMRRR